MDKTLVLHHYGICERITDGFFGEPLNSLTNLGFIITAIALMRYCKRNSDIKGYAIYDIYVMIGLIFSIGIGSSLFHMYPTPLTETIDMVPIVLFINVFFLSTMLRVVKCTVFETCICYLAFGGVTHILVSQFPNAFNDSIAYLSTMGSLVVIAFYLNVKRRATARAFLLAALLGVVSLFFRSIDNALCDKVPIGTHFLWHTFNAILIYILMVQLIRNVNRRARMLRDANQHFA